MRFKYFLVILRGFMKAVQSVFKQRRIQGEIIRDAGLASLVNFIYVSDKSYYEYLLVVVSFLGIIIGVVLKEGVDNEWNNN